MPDKHYIEVTVLVKVKFKVITFCKKKGYEGKVHYDGQEFRSIAQTKLEVRNSLQKSIKEYTQQ